MVSPAVKAAVVDDSQVVSPAAIEQVTPLGVAPSIISKVLTEVPPGTTDTIALRFPASQSIGTVTSTVAAEVVDAEDCVTPCG